MRRLSAPFPILFFAGAAHGMNHVLLTLYLTLVLVLTNVWHIPYTDLIALWAIGAMLVGAGAPLAGWLSDRWGETKVLVLCFLGLGTGAVLCGLSQNTWQLEASLAVLGLSGSIYHPVGISWVVKHAHARGRAIALTGICGSFGVALGPVTAGALATFWSWRAGFILPGILTLGLGFALLWFHVTRRIVDRGDDAVPSTHAPTRGDMTRAFGVLAITMTAMFIANAAFITALPKLVQTASVFSHSSFLAIGIAVGLIQLTGSSAQFIGGRLADSRWARRAYLLTFVALAVVMMIAALSSGWALLAAAVLVILVFEGMAPLETMLVAHYSPTSRRGLVFGVRYALATIGNPVGVWLIARYYSPASGFTYMLIVLAVISLVALCAGLFLPHRRMATAAAAE